VSPDRSPLTSLLRLASLLLKQGHDVFVVMTQDATEFISPLTLQTLSKNPVTTSFYDEKESWRPGHIDLADRANLLLIAPATAHIIAELANGLASHPLRPSLAHACADSARGRP